tara:strand:- start:4828 stop:5016 length:189 start_codon:yes stop_codon:yes gene_type:complete
MNENIMKTLSNATRSKIVNITSREGSFTCMYCDVYQGEQQVLDSETYKSEKTAIKWANKQLA